MMTGAPEAGVGDIVGVPVARATAMHSLKIRSITNLAITY